MTKNVKICTFEQFINDILDNIHIDHTSKFFISSNQKA